jgi:hypothetical protein
MTVALHRSSDAGTGVDLNQNRSDRFRIEPNLGFQATGFLLEDSP